MEADQGIWTLHVKPPQKLREELISMLQQDGTLNKLSTGTDRVENLEAEQKTGWSPAGGSSSSGLQVGAAITALESLFRKGTEHMAQKAG